MYNNDNNHIMQGLNFKLNTDPRFMFKNKIKDNMFDYRMSNGLVEHEPVRQYKWRNHFVPDKSVLLPDRYSGYRPKGYDRFGNFNPSYVKTDSENNQDISRIDLPNKIDVNPYSINTTPAPGGENILPSGQSIRRGIRLLNRLNRQEQRQNNNNNIQTGSENGTANKDNNNKDLSYNINQAYNSIKSWGRHYPTFDSVQQYLDKKKNTPDTSDFENAKNYAMRPTDVQRQTANHISGNLKFNPYDYSAQANMINAQAANGVNAISRQGRGNINAIAGHINNLLSNTATSAGNEYMKGFEANEKARMAVAQANMEADKFNATADNNAEANYVQSRNNAATQDKTNAINALNNYASQRYAINGNYENQLRTLRDQMVSNIGEEGRTAYETNRANTNKQYNYWYDQNGVQHYIPQEGGARYVDPQNPEPYKIEDGEFAKVLDKYKDDNAVRDELYKMMNTNGYARGRYDWYNKYKA